MIGGLAIRKRRHLLPLLCIITLPQLSCVPIISGHLSTIAYSGPEPEATFVVHLPAQSTLTDRNIASLISKEMISRGFIQANNEQEAELGVAYSYSIGSGQLVTSWAFNQYTGKNEPRPTTAYPRFFAINIAHLRLPSESPKSDSLVWQAELYSRGTGTNISLLAQAFIPALFEHFDHAVANKSFSKSISP